MGLVYFKRYRMEIDLSKARTLDSPMAAGYSFADWNTALLETHAEVKYRCFCDELDAHVFPSLSNLDGCLRLMRDISGRAGFLPRTTWLLRFRDSETGRVHGCGTIQGVRNRAGIGAIQNVGIVPQHRGKGLGKFLVNQSLTGFREAGLSRVTLEVTSKNVGAIRLYHRLGFRTVRTVYKTAEIAYL